MNEKNEKEGEIIIQKLSLNNYVFGLRLVYFYTNYRY